MTQPFFSEATALIQEPLFTFQSTLGSAKASDFAFLATLECSNCLENYIKEIRYRITKDGFFQILSVFIIEKEEYDICAQYYYDKKQTLKENALYALDRYIKTNENWGETADAFIKSEIITKEDFELLKLKRHLIPEEVLEKPLIKHIQEMNLHCRVENVEKGLYVACCPRKASHPLMIAVNQHSEEWGCGYCKKKGGLEELKTWIKEIADSNKE